MMALPRAQSGFTVPRVEPIIDMSANVASDAIGGIKQAAGGVRDVYAEKVRKKAMADDAAALIDVENQYTLRLTELELEAQKAVPPSGDGYIKAVREGRAKAAEEVLKGIPSYASEMARQQAGNILKRYDGDSDNRATIWQGEKSTEFALNALDTALSTDIAGVIANPDSAAAARQASHARLSAISGSLTPDQERAQHDRVDAEISASAVTGMVDANRFEDAAALAKEYAPTLSGDRQRALDSYIEQGKQRHEREVFDSLSLGITQGTVKPDQLAEMHKAKELDDGTYNSLLVQVANAEARKEAARKAAVNEARDTRFAELQVAVDDERIGRSGIDQAYERGEIDPSHWSQLVRQESGRKVKNTKASDFISMINMGVPLDPTDSDTKAGAEAAFEQEGAADLLFTDPAAAMGIVGRYAAKGIIPEQAQVFLRGRKSSGTPEQQMDAIEVISDLYQDYPNATDAAFTAGEVAEAISFRAKLDAGIDPKQAYQSILVEREARNEPPGATSLTKSRVAEARALVKDLDLKDAVKEADTGAWSFDQYSGGVLAKQQMVADYQQAFQTYYVQHGDEKLAKQQAAAVTKRTIGKSRTNNGKIMMHPPEKYYPDTGDKNWMRDALVAGVSEAMGADVSRKDIELISDAETARAVRDSEKPSYAVSVNTGGSVQIMPSRWTFDAEFAQQQADARAQAKAEETQDGARNASARRAEQIAAWATMDRDSVAWNMLTPEGRKRQEESERMAAERATKMREKAPKPKPAEPDGPFMPGTSLTPEQQKRVLETQGAE